jgi:thiamine-monophosphate kinase
MMDLSDGLGADLPRLARASGVGFEIDEKALPLNRDCTNLDAISDGEDYELLFAVSPKDSRLLLSRWQRRFPKVPLTRIGRLNRKSVRGGRAAFKNRKFPRGYVHFQKR